MRFRTPRRWSDLSRVERVDLYTRQSLYLLLCGLCGGVLVSVLPDTSGNAQSTALLAGGAVVTALGMLTMTVVVGNYPVMHPLPWRLVTALVVAGVAYLAAVGLPADGTVRGAVTTVVVANLVAALGGLPDNRVTVGLVVTSGAIFGLSGGKPVSVAAGIAVGALIVFSVRVSLWLYGIVAELDAARHALAQLAVAEERLRFSRDVHDVLGRRLSTITVQAELAATLAERGDDRAAARMLEVRGVAHEALREARELARGYRPTDLTTELEGARSLLRSAGIEVRLDVGVVPRAWHEAAGWVVRESVTNVLRHSAAGEVRISYADGDLRVENDGVRVALDGAGDGSGLRGLRERLAPLGATLDTAVESGPDGGTDGGRWTVAAHLPGAGPISAAASAPPSPTPPTEASR